MKVFIALFLISGFQLILGNCPECDGLSSLYELIGCGVSCRRGKCPTAYNCDNLLIRNKNHQQCYFNGQFYDVGTTLPDKYPSSDGTQNCSYQCNNDDGGISYYFNPYDCVDNLEAPTEDQCNKMLQLITPTYIQLGVAVSYTPGVCNIQLVVGFDFPPGNCSKKRKCCSYFTELYKRGTSFEIVNRNCTCSCPPLVLCSNQTNVSP